MVLTRWGNLVGRKSGGVVAALLLLNACSGKPHAPEELTVDDVIGRHVVAMGGAKAYEEQRNMRADVRIVEPEFTVDGVYRATADGRMRIDVFAGGASVFSEGIDRQGAWQQGGKEAEIEPIGGLAAKALRRGAHNNIHGLFDLEGMGHKARLLGQEKIDGTSYHVIHVIYGDGSESFFYIDPESWLVARERETSALHPDLDATEHPSETVFLKFEKHCGLLRSTGSRKTNRTTGKEIQRTLITSFSCNTAEPPLQIPRQDPPLQPVAREGA